MSLVRTAVKVAGGFIGVVLLAAGGGYLWASTAASSTMAMTYETHRVEFPIPFPLTAAELEALRVEAVAALPPPDPAAPPVDPLAGVDLEAIARDRAIARGKHLVESRFVCVECHGANFAGGTMIDDPALGQIHGPNLTGGKGGVIAGYTAADWDRKVRHGVNPKGLGGAMPSEDFFGMSDRELSDVASYVLSQPPVDQTEPPVTLGPLGTVLMATGQLPIAASKLKDHHAAHPVDPPETAVTAEFGAHMAQICTGCHRSDFSGGPVAGGAPDWPPASNLTSGAEGLDGWTWEDFQRVMLEGKTKGGVTLREPMSLMPKYAKNMSEDELRALWLYISALPPKSDGA